MDKKLLRSVREYKKQSFLTPVLVAAEVFVEVLIPLLMAKIIDVGIMNGDMAYIIKLGALLVLLAVVALFFGAKAGQLAAVASSGYAKNLRHDIFYKIQDFSFGNIDHFSTPGLVTRLTTDITNVQMAYMFTIRLLARAPIMIVMSLIMTVTISPAIAFMMLITIPVLGGLLIFIAKKAHPHFIKVFDEYDELNNVVQENVNVARVVKAYVREDHEVEKFGKISGIVFRLFTKAEKIVAWNSPTMQFTMYIVVLAMVLIGGESIISGDMLTGELTSVIVYALQILTSLMMVSFVFVMIMIAEASTERINEVLDEVPEMEDKADAVTEVTNGDIEFEHVNFSYAGEGGNLSLKDVNLHIKSGQIVGIIGGTGSAKSTLVQLIPRLYDVTSGTVKVGGTDVRDYNLKALRDQVSVVLQKNVLFTGSIYENIRWGDETASDAEVERVCKLAQADGFIREFPNQYETMIVEGGNNVSGGQKQRLCIARALLKKPKILILDDSTSAVDTKTDALIRQAFREEIPDTTRIIIAQRVSSVEDADVIIVMDKGEISGIGTSEELLKVLQVERSRIGLTLAIRVMSCTSFSYVLLRLIRFCFFTFLTPFSNSSDAPIPLISPLSITIITSAIRYRRNSLRNDDPCRIRNLFSLKAWTNQRVCFRIYRACRVVQNRGSSAFSKAPLQYKVSASDRLTHYFRLLIDHRLILIRKLSDKSCPPAPVSQYAVLLPHHSQFHHPNGCSS